MTTLNLPEITPSEYLVRERAARVKSEYVDGRVHAMTGASRAHNLIAGNLFTALRTQLRGRPCEVYISDMRVKVARAETYTYPDVVAVCGNPHFEDACVDTLLNPDLIVEVLSTTTEAYDRGKKFAYYRRLESLREYVLIACERVRVERYRRNGEDWILTEVGEVDGTLTIESVGCSVALSALYERVGIVDASNENPIDG